MTTPTNEPIDGAGDEMPTREATQPWVALLKLSEPSDVDRAAEAYFGPGKAAEAFIGEFGIDLREFMHHYLEVDLAQAPIGPVVRGNVRPIVAIRRGDGGKFRAHVFSHDVGFFNDKIGMAWIRAEDWDQLVGN